MEARAALTATFALAASCAALIAAPVAGATTYNSDTPIIINDDAIASPYPSSITVSGTAGPITDVNVGLDGLAHGVPNDVSIALVAPSGQALLLVDCVGDTTDAFGVFITLDDAAVGGPDGGHLPNNGGLSSGTFKPTSYCAGTTFPAPGPMTYGLPGPLPAVPATFANTFNGSSAIGTWSLYVFDNQTPTGGSIPGGWSLDVKPDVTPLPEAVPTPTPTPTPASKKKCKKKKKSGRTAAASACKKKKRK